MSTAEQAACVHAPLQNAGERMDSVYYEMCACPEHGILKTQETS